MMEGKNPFVPFVILDKRTHVSAIGDDTLGWGAQRTKNWLSLDKSAFAILNP